jgi:PTS system fructose-specific IIA component/PTS system nitrogen regulatory IIA component
MKFSDFVSPEAIVADLQATDKEGVIREMARGLVAASRIDEGEYENIVRAVLNREELGSTGIGRGVAVPHTRHPSVDRLVGTVAVSRKGIDFASIDGEQVTLLFLLVSPVDRPGDHLRALESITRTLRDDQFCQQLKKAENADAIRRLLQRSDEQQGGG